MRSDALLCRPYILTLLLIVVLLSAGCSTKIRGWSQESYRSSGFNTNVLNQEGLALLPVIVLKSPAEKAKDPGGKNPSSPYAPDSPSGDQGKENQLNAQDAYRVSLSEILLSKIQSRWPTIRLISPGDVLKRLNDEGLTTTYSKFNRDFPRVGFDSAMLKSFGRALNCRYLFISQAVVIESKSEASITFVWTFGRKSVLRSVKISGQIWDTVSGQQAWEGSGVGYNRLAAYEGSPLTEEIASQAVDSLLKTIMP